jgi:hypothetical protein
MYRPPLAQRYLYLQGCFDIWKLKDEVRRTKTFPLLHRTEQLIGEARIFTNKRKREAKKESVQEELRNTSIQYTIHK